MNIKNLNLFNRTYLIQQLHKNLHIPHLYIIHNKCPDTRYEIPSMYRTIQNIYNRIQMLRLTHSLYLTQTLIQFSQTLGRFLKDIDEQNQSYMETQVDQGQIAKKYFCNITVCANIQQQSQIRLKAQQVLESGNLDIGMNVNINWLFITDEPQFMVQLYLYKSVEFYKTKQQISQLSPKKLLYETTTVIQPYQSIKFQTITYIQNNSYTLFQQIKNNFYANIRRWARKQNAYLESLSENIKKTSSQLFYTNNMFNYNRESIQTKITKMKTSIYHVTILFKKMEFQIEVKQYFCDMLSCLRQILPLFQQKYRKREQFIYKCSSKINQKIENIIIQIQNSSERLIDIISRVDLSPILQNAQIQQAIKYLLPKCAQKLNILSYLSSIIWLCQIYKSLQKTQQIQQETEQDQNIQCIIKVQMTQKQMQKYVDQLNGLTEEQYRDYKFVNNFYIFGQMYLDNGEQQILGNQWQDNQIPIESDHIIEQLLVEDSQKCQLQIFLHTTKQQILNNIIPSIIMIKNPNQQNKYNVIIEPFQVLKVQQWEDHLIRFEYKSSYKNKMLRDNYSEKNSENNEDQYHFQQSQRQFDLKQQYQPTRRQKKQIYTSFIQQKLCLKLPISIKKDQQYSSMVQLSKFKKKYPIIKDRYMNNAVQSRKICLEYMSSLAQIYMDTSQFYQALAILLLLLHLCVQDQKLRQMKEKAVDIAFDEISDPLTYSQQFDRQIIYSFTVYSETCIKIGQCYMGLKQPHKNLQYIQQCISHLPIFYNPDKYLYNLSSYLVPEKIEYRKLTPLMKLSLKFYNCLINAYLCYGQYQISLQYADKLFNILFAGVEDINSWSYYAKEMYASALVTYAHILETKRIINLFKGTLMANKNNRDLKRQIIYYQKSHQIKYQQLISKQKLLQKLDILEHQSKCHFVLEQWQESLRIQQRITSIYSQQNNKDFIPFIKHKRINSKLSEIRCLRHMGDINQCYQQFQELIVYLNNAIQSYVDEESCMGLSDQIHLSAKTIYTEYAKFFIDIGSISDAMAAYHEWVQLYNPNKTQKQDFIKLVSRSQINNFQIYGKNLMATY